MVLTAKQVLSERGMSQGALARLVGIGDAHINKILNGKTRPTLDLAMRIAHALGATVEELWSSDNLPVSEQDQEKVKISVI